MSLFLIKLKANLFLLIVIIVWNATLLACTKKTDTVKSVELSELEKPALVKTLTLSPGEFSSSLTYEAVTQPSQDINLRSISSGYVEKIFKQAGQRVKKGEAIAHIQTSTASSKMMESKANFDFVSKEFGRMHKLFQDGTITKSQYDEIINKKEMSSSQYQIAQQNYAQSIIKSPIDGVLEKLDLEVGELVSPQQDLARVVDTSVLKIVIGVSSADIFKIALDQQTEVVFAQIPSKKFSAKITHISSVADSMTKTFQVEIKLENLDNFVKAGLIASVNLEIGHKNEALAIPKNAILYDDKQSPYVYVNDHGKAQRRDLVLGQSDHSNVEVIQGLNAADQLVVEGQQTILPGKNIANDRIGMR